jgi:hypothetical protein
MSKKTKAAQAIQPRPPIRQNSRILLLSVLAIVISCLIAYFPALHSDFVMVDDHEHIFNNTHLLPISWDSISYFWLHPYQSLYIPVSYNVFALLATVSQSLYFHGCSALSAKFNPYVFHAANLILHIANTLLVLSILRRAKMRLRLWRERCSSLSIRFKWSRWHGCPNSAVCWRLFLACSVLSSF